MINELYIYDRDNSLFKSVLQLSNVLEGRYHISPDYGHDLNSDNLAEYVKDPKYGLTSPETIYPLCVLLTPRSRIRKINGQRWEEFVIDLFFLTTAYQQGGTIKLLDTETNTSGQQIWYDWEDMKNEAMLFLDRLKETIKKSQYTESITLRSVLNMDEDGAGITRLTKRSNDRLNGVSLSFLLYAKTENCSGVGPVSSPSLPGVDGQFLLMRFRVDAEGSPMTSNDTVLQNAILRNKKVIVFANGSKLDADYGDGKIDFSDGTERHIIKIKEEDKITFYGGVATREIITVYQEKELA